MQMLQCVVLMVKNRLACQSMRCQEIAADLGQEDTLEDTATHSNILTWRIQGQKSLAGYEDRTVSKSRK